MIFNGKQSKQSLMKALVISLILISCFLFYFSLASAEYSDCNIYGNCKPAGTTITSGSNYSINVNNTNYLQGYTPNDFLKLNQSSPQLITDGAPNFNDGLSSSDKINFASAGNAILQATGVDRINLYLNQLLYNQVVPVLDWGSQKLFANDGVDEILDWSTAGIADFDDTNIVTTGGISSTNISRGSVKTNDVEDSFIQSITVADKDNYGGLSITDGTNSFYLSTVPTGYAGQFGADNWRTRWDNGFDVGMEVWADGSLGWNAMYAYDGVYDVFLGDYANKNTYGSSAFTAYDNSTPKHVFQVLNGNYYLEAKDADENTFFLIDYNGNTNTTGNITADYFIGDGSLLTGISSGNSSFNQTLTDATYLKLNQSTPQITIGRFNFPILNVTTTASTTGAGESSYIYAQNGLSTINTASFDGGDVWFQGGDGGSYNKTTGTGGATGSSAGRAINYGGVGGNVTSSVGLATGGTGGWLYYLGGAGGVGKGLGTRVGRGGAGGQAYIQGGNGGQGGDTSSASSGQSTGGTGGQTWLQGGTGGQAVGSSTKNLGGTGGMFSIRAGYGYSSIDTTFSPATNEAGDGGVTQIVLGQGGQASGGSTSNIGGDNGNLLISFPPLSSASGTGAVTGTQGNMYIQPYNGDGIVSPSFYFMVNGTTGNINITKNISIAGVVSGNSFTNVTPLTTNTYSIGSTTLRWLKGWFSGLDVNGNTLLNGNVNITGNLSVKRPYGMFSSTEDQTLVSADTAYPVTFNWTEDAYLVTKEGDSNFSIAQSGDYLIELSAVFQTAVANKKSHLWVQLWNGTAWNNIPRSNTQLTMRTANSDYVVAVPFIIDILPTEKFRIMWAGDDSGVFMNYMTNTSYAPETPSIIMTLSKISELTE